jgi:hypothetical protein
MFKRFIVRGAIVTVAAIAGSFISTGIAAIVILFGILWIVAGFGG